MLRKKNISILLVMLAVAVLMLSAAEALAGDLPMSCTFVTANSANTAITMSAITDGSGNFPIERTDPTTGNTVYVWAYQVSGANPNQLNALEIVCPTDMGYKIVSGGQVQAAGAGDSYTVFGVGDYQSQVVRMAAQQGSNAYGLPAGSYSFLTTRVGDLRNTSMAIKLSNSTYYCPNIAGPACYVPAELGALGLKRFTFDDPAIYVDAYYRGDGKFDHAVDWNGNPVTLNDLSTSIPGMTHASDGAVFKIGNQSVTILYLTGGAAYKFSYAGTSINRPPNCPSSTCAYSTTSLSWNQMSVCPQDGSCINKSSCPGTNYSSASVYAGACK